MPSPLRCPTRQGHGIVVQCLFPRQPGPRTPVTEAVRPTDTSGDLLRKLNVQTQATMIVYKGKAETGRLVGETDPAAIEALLRTGM